MSDRSRSPRVERVHLEEAALEEQAKLVAAALSDDIRARLQQMVKEGLVKEGDFDLHAMSIFSALNPDLQDRVLSYCDTNKIYMTNARSKSGFLVAACEKARKGSLDARGFGTVDPYKEYLLTIAKPKREWVDLVPEQQWLEQTTDAQEVIFDVRVDPEAGVSAIRLCLQLDRTVRSVKERLAAVGVHMPVQKMKLREASIGYMRDERTLAYYNLKSGSKVQLVAKQRGGRRQAVEKMG